MRPLLLSLLLLLCLHAGAQERQPFLFIQDSIGAQYPKWVFVDGDRPEYASPAFDDHALPDVYSHSLKAGAGERSPFKGIAWLRLHFRVDTALAHQPLAFGLTQNGAAEVYLDGRPIYRRGLVGDATHARYYDPQRYPVALSITDTLPHLLAVRYANWNYNNHNYLFDEEPPGFAFQFRAAQDAIDGYITNDNFTGIFCCILFGIFSILAILHFLFFLYYRQERSNLWFSLFALALATLSLLPYTGRTVTNPKLVLMLGYYSFFLAVLTCLALSGSLNSLFSRRPVRFRLMSLFFLLCCLLYIFAAPLQGYLIFALIIAATFEAIFVIGSAIIRRVPGARIIGAGLSLFILMLLAIVFLAVVRREVNVQLTGTTGIIIFALVCIALLCIPVSLSAYLAYGFARVSRNLKQQLLEVETLSARAREQEAEKQQMLAQQNEMLEREVTERTREVMRQKTEIEGQHAALLAEKNKSDELLRNILPAEVAEELKQNGSSAARQYDEVSVLFTDFVDFTGVAEQMHPQELVQELNECFTVFDATIEKHGLEKIKTIGDAYMAVCGLPLRDKRHAQKTVQAALEITHFIQTRREGKPLFRIRVGIHSGPVVAGIIGVKKFAYDIWGDTVNTAARMEQHSEPGRINISGTTYALVRDAFVCTPRGRVVAKHKGEVEMYFVETATAAAVVRL
jgi:class 3 adenylate cyclase